MKRLLNPCFSFIVLCTFFSFISCVEDVKDLYDPNLELENPLETIDVPDNFDWKTINSMDIEVRVADEFNGQYGYYIEVFDTNPVSNNSLKPLTAGYARGNAPFVSVVTVSKGVEYLYIRQTTPVGLSSVRSAKVDGKKIVCDFGASGTTGGTRAAATRADWNITPPDVDPTDASLFPTSAPADAIDFENKWTSGTASAWKKVKITSDVTLTSSNAGQYIEYYIAGKVTMTFNAMANRKYFVMPGADLTINGDLGMGQANWFISIGTGAKLTVHGKVKPEQSNRLYNLGTITANSIHQVGTSVLYNAGDIKVIDTSATALYSDTHSNLYNLGTINVDGGWKATASDNGDVTLYNNSAITVGGLLDLNSKTIKFLNDVDGNISCANFNSTGSASTMNYGVINVDGNTQVESQDTWTNKGKWITGTMGTKSYGAQYLNECYLEVKDKLTFLQARFVNAKGSYIVTKDLHIENTRIDMYGESFINVTGTAFAKGSREDHQEGVFGMDASQRSLFRMVKLTTDTDGQQHLYLSGNLQVACSDYPEQYANGQYNKPVWILANGAEWAADDTNTVSIPESECNAGWNTNPKPDPEPDPEDPDPIENGTTYSYLFEDMWPLYGDYDMNDVVLRVNKITTYADVNNKVNKFSFDVSIRAVGAEKMIGGAVMLNNVTASAVKSVNYSINTPSTFNVTNTGVEQNQRNAVIPLFDNAHKFIGKEGFVNTQHNGSNVANPPVMTVTVEFSTPVALGDLNAESLNFFIITDINAKPVNKGNRREIHIVDYIPTNMADTSTFGNNNDGSNPSAGKYYRSKDNLPWGIATPNEFRWPLEYVQIQDAYAQFESWVTSGGADNKEWWKTPTDGKVY